jgi:hypothetical protein
LNFFALLFGLLLFGFMISIILGLLKWAGKKSKGWISEEYTMARIYFRAFP